MTINRSTLYQDDYFSLESALLLAKASRLNYELESTIKDQAQQWGYADCRVIDVGRPQCYIMADEQSCVLSFRGTQSLGNWIDNAKASPVPHDYGDVHRGFSAGYKALGPLILKSLKELLTPNRTLFVTGHSLGGALATIAAAELHGQFLISGVYTFGQPKTGLFGSFFDEYFGGKFFRFVNNEDVVPRLPLNYEHVGQLQWFNAKGALPAGRLGEENFDIPPDLSDEEYEVLTAEIQAIQIRLETSSVGTLGRQSQLDLNLSKKFPAIADHAIDAYVENLEHLVG